MNIKAGGTYKVKSQINNIYKMFSKEEAAKKWPSNSYMQHHDFDLVGVRLDSIDKDYPNWDKFMYTGKHYKDYDYLAVVEVVNESMNFEVGKAYKTRDGQKAFIYDVNLKNGNGFTVAGKITDDSIGNECLRSWLSNGMYYGGCNSGLDLVSEWHEPVIVEGWVNVFDPPSTFTFFYKTKKEAEKSAKAMIESNKYKLLATVFVSGKSDE